MLIYIIAARGSQSGRGRKRTGKLRDGAARANGRGMADGRRRFPNGDPGDHRAGAQRRHGGDRGDEDQPHAHRLQHDHLRGARLHRRAVHREGRDGFDRARASDVHPRHGRDLAREARAFRDRRDRARRHSGHQRRLCDRQPPQPHHAQPADLPRRRAGRILLLHGALARYRRHAAGHHHRHLRRRAAGPHPQTAARGRAQPGPGRHHRDERPDAGTRARRPPRPAHRGPHRGAWLSRADRTLWQGCGAGRDRPDHGSVGAVRARTHPLHSGRGLRGRGLHGRRRDRYRQGDSDRRPRRGRGRGDDHRPHRRLAPGQGGSTIPASPPPMPAPRSPSSASPRRPTTRSTTAASAR